LLGLGAAGGTGYNFWQQQQFKSEYEQAAVDGQREIEKTASSLQTSIKTEINKELNSIQSENESLVDGMTRSNSRLERRIKDDVQTLDERLTETETQIVTLKGFSEAAKYAYVKAEVEYFLQTGNNRLSLAQDVGSALSALKAADERLNILKDPSLVPVRSVVLEEIQELKSVEQPDVEGIALTLASVAKQVNALPLRMHDDEDYFKEEIKMKEGEGWRVGASNVWRSMKGTLDRLVEVRDATPSDVPLLSIEDESLLYRNLEIQLQSARLASLKADTANYQTSIDSAITLMETYFDAEQQSVKAAIDSVSSIRDKNLQPKLPDISTSLKMLRALQAGDSIDDIQRQPLSAPNQTSTAGSTQTTEAKSSEKRQRLQENKYGQVTKSI